MGRVHEAVETEFHKFYPSKLNGSHWCGRCDNVEEDHPLTPEEWAAKAKEISCNQDR